MVESAQDAYDRGEAAGKVLARLEEHDKHFARINGSIDQLVAEVHALVLAMQRLGDQAGADRSTVITTASALKEAEEARRSQGERSWSPVARLFAGLGAAAALASLVGAVYLALK